MSKKDHKTIRRTSSSFLFGGVSLFMFFPYQSLVWSFALFLLALAGVVIAAVNLIGIHKAQSAQQALPQKAQVLSRLAWWLTFVPFVIAAAGLLLTGVLACSLYL